MAKGYAEGPASDEREAALEQAARPAAEVPADRVAVVGSTADNPERHFLGWRDEVDPDELFASGQAWGISLVRRRP